jgi:hypothetical protein
MPGWFYAQTREVPDKPKLPVVQIDEKGLMYFKATEFLNTGNTKDTGAWGNVGYGRPINGVYFDSFLDYTKKKYGSASDPLGVNTLRGTPVVEYKKIQTTDLSWMPQSGGAIIYENGKIKSVISGNPEGLTAIIPEQAPEDIFSGVNLAGQEQISRLKTAEILSVPSLLPLENRIVRFLVRLVRRFRRAASLIGQ